MEEGLKADSTGAESKIKIWFKNNWIFVLIFSLAIAIRLYYYFLTINQPLWFDEAEYMAAAKGFAGIMHYQLSSIRFPGFSLVMSLFFIFGIANEAIMRFFGLLIPSLLVIFLTYLCTKEMYSDNRIALVSMAIMAVLWEHLFYSNRFQTENFALIFQLIAFYILFRCYIKKQNVAFVKPKNSLIWIVLFSAIAVLFRPGNLPFIPAVLVFMLFLNKDLFSKKKIKLTALVAFILLAAFAFISRTSSYQALLATYYHPDYPLAFNTLGVFSGFYESIVAGIPPLLLYAFIFGIAIFLIDLAINFKKIPLNSESSDFRSDIFNFILILSVMIIFIFVVRPYNGFEYRWFFPMALGMLALTGKGLITFSEYVGNAVKSKAVITVVLIIILSLGVYTQLAHADSIIRDKLDSYSQVKDAALWMKANSNSNDIIWTTSSTQMAYYAEREIVNDNQLVKNSSMFQDYVTNHSVRYVVWSVFEPVNISYVIQWARENQDNISIKKAYFADAEQKQPILIIYETKSA